MTKREEIKARLEQIRAKAGGVLRPDDVVKDARSKSSPLHDEFEWSDSAAAEKFRLSQARELIRSVTVEITTTTTRFAAPFYVKDPRLNPGEQGYGSVLEIRTDTAVAMEALTAEFDRAIALLERALTLADALGLTGQVQALLAQTKAIRESVVATAQPPRTASKV